VLLIVAVSCQLVAVLALLWLAYNKDSSMVALWIVVVLVSLPLGAAAVVLWRIGWRRAGTLPPNLLPKERRRTFLVAFAVTYIGYALGIGGFVYLALTLEGSRRLAFGFAGFLVCGAVANLAGEKVTEVLRARFPTIYGRRWPKWVTWVFFGLSLVASGLLVLVGSFWPDLLSL
jgi:hypothetical protein